MRSKRMIFIVPLVVILTVLTIFLIVGNIAGAGGRG
jgi:hypothetical protein